MKKVLLPICLLVLISCSSRKENKTTPQADVPKALQDNKESSLISISKRSSYDHDLVKELYKEKVKSTPALQEIEILIDKLNSAKNDSLEIYNDFKAKNQHYYNSASSHLSSIKDSLLKKEIQSVLGRNTLAYNNKILGLNELVTNLNGKSGSADDRHTILMILISIGMMNEYQDKNLPSFKPIESVISNYTILLQKMDSVIHRNK